MHTAAESVSVERVEASLKLQLDTDTPAASKEGEPLYPVVTQLPLTQVVLMSVLAPDM